VRAFFGAVFSRPFHIPCGGALSHPEGMSGPHAPERAGGVRITVKKQSLLGRTSWVDTLHRAASPAESARRSLPPRSPPRPHRPAQSGDPIKIGFSLALTGPLAPNGKQALLGAKIWEEEINAKGGLLGRKVELVNYDDQSNPANVPGIYTKLLDVDKVDLVNGPYGTNLIAPALPVVMQKGKMLIGLFGLDANKEFHYARYFSMISAGPKPSQAFTEGYFQVAAQQKPKPETVALAAEDAEFSRNACEGARENAKTFGFNIAYDKSFPPGTTLLPDHSCAASGQCRSCRDLFLSAELGRHSADGQ
jgi:ABC-type branched-subunit amino acid transport system substrate-binding protein